MKGFGEGLVHRVGPIGTPRHTRTRSDPNPSFKYFEYGAFEDEDDENDPSIPANARKTGKGYALL